MKTNSAVELSKTEGGRRKLARMQRKHRLDILQPGDPKFEKVWGKKFRMNQKYIADREKETKRLWKESEEKARWEKKQL